MSEIVFILGAGASRDAGAPVMNDFLEVAENLNKNGQSGEYKKEFAAVFSAISDLQIGLSKSKYSLDNIESVFEIFEMASMIKKFPNRGKNDIDELLKSIRWLIFKTLEQTIKFQVLDGQILPSETYNNLSKLVINLNNEGRKKRCSIITFNYDIALDYALHFNLFPADYYLSEIDISLKAPLFKLHGSLNWLKCPKCEKVFSWDIKDFFNKYKYRFLEEGQSVTIDLPTKLSEAGLKHCESELLNPTPYILPPTFNKLEYQKSISNVWLQAALELSDAENIFISGYSLPETDNFFKYLFALGSIGKNRIKRFWVYDINSEVNGRYKKFIGYDIESKYKFIPDTFSKMIEDVQNLSL